MYNYIEYKNKIQHNGKVKLPKIVNCFKRRKTDTTRAKRKRTKEQAMTYKTLLIKQKIEQHKPHYKSGVNSGAPDG